MLATSASAVFMSTAKAEEATAAYTVRPIVHISYSGLESRLDEATLQQGVFQGQYRADADIVLKAQKAMPGPLELFYSLCFAEPGTKWSGCVDGKYIPLPEGLLAGEKRLSASLKMRGRTGTLRVPRGNGHAEVSIKQLQPEITVRVERGKEDIFKADYLLPPVAPYACRYYCPGTE